jgi:hypothetical protein
MPDTEWLKMYAAYQGRVQQLVASDIVEHGKPHDDREASLNDLKQYAVEVGGLAFELYATIEAVQARWGGTITESKRIMDDLEEKVKRSNLELELGKDVLWANRDPDG